MDFADGLQRGAASEVRGLGSVTPRWVESVAPDAWGFSACVGVRLWAVAGLSLASGDGAWGGVSRRASYGGGVRAPAGREDERGSPPFGVSSLWRCRKSGARQTQTFAVLSVTTRQHHAASASGLPLPARLAPCLPGPPWERLPGFSPLLPTPPPACACRRTIVRVSEMVPLCWADGTLPFLSVGPHAFHALHAPHAPLPGRWRLQCLGPVALAVLGDAHPMWQRHQCAPAALQGSGADELHCGLATEWEDIVHRQPTPGSRLVANQSFSPGLATRPHSSSKLSRPHCEHTRSVTLRAPAPTSASRDLLSSLNDRHHDRPLLVDKPRWRGGSSPRTRTCSIPYRSASPRMAAA